MLKPDQQQTLTTLAREAIAYAVAHGHAPDIDITDYDSELQQQGASFVTLTIDKQLRGCIGMLQAVRPLVEDIANNACAAALHDHRFSPLRADELDKIDVHISVLEAPEPLACASEQELLDKLEAGKDGLILSDGARKATFLPSVWDSIQDKAEFVRHLKLKAGIPADHWDASMTASVYRVQEW